MSTKISHKLINRFCSIETQKIYLANCVIKISLIGIIGNNIVELANPESKPVYLLNFIKCRFHDSKLCIYDNVKLTQVSIHNNIIEHMTDDVHYNYSTLSAAKNAIDEYHMFDHEMYYE